MYVSPESRFVINTDRRWNRVVYLCSVDGAEPSPPGDDAWVLKAFVFWRAMLACRGDEREQKRVARAHPHFYEAYTLRKQADPVTRASVEALLLAGTSPNKVAEAYGVNPEVIRIYAAVWYDLGEQRPSRLHVSTVHIPEIHSGSFTSDNHSAFFKLIANGFHPGTLMEVMESGELNEADYARHASMQRTFMQHKMTRTTVSMPVNGFTGPSIMMAHSQADRDRRDAAAVGGTTLSDLCSLILQGASWSILDPGVAPQEMHRAQQRLLENKPPQLAAMDPEQ